MNFYFYCEDKVTQAELKEIEPNWEKTLFPAGQNYPFLKLKKTRRVHHSDLQNVGGMSL